MNDVPFASNEVRLSPRGWLIALIVVSAIFYFTPHLWERIEKLEPGPDYRIPYSLGNDYRLYSRYSRLASARNKILVLGDSVVWGHYVAAEQTLSHYLNELAGHDCFANLAVDGIHPAAMAGLVDYYGRSIAAGDVILHCNLLWMSSKRHDLQIEKEFSFNHPRLVPQFLANIPCYRESASGRLGIVVERRLPFFGLARHVEIAYFGNADLPAWTIRHPYENPARAVTLKLPSPNEPPSPTPVAEPWTKQHLRKFGPAWVELKTSFQWSSFKRTIRTLRRRGNRVFVLVGPLNEHMLTEDSLQTYWRRKREVEMWLDENRIAHWIAPVLPSDEYADASHPLSGGYAMLAEQLFQNESFLRFQTGAPQ